MRSKDIKDRLKYIDDFLLDQYKNSKQPKKRDWRTYEQQLMNRVKKGIKNLEPLIDEAINFEFHRGQGRKPDLELKHRVLLLLIQQFIGKSNRTMASVLTIFSIISDINVEYKTVERLYSDKEVEIAIYNLHMLILKKKGVKEIEACGDGTGYSLTIKKHYASVVSKKKDKAKVAKPKKKKAFVYSFNILDLNSKMYVAFGTSMKSEKQAFDRAMKMLKYSDIEIKSVRLDKYYSLPSYVDKFDDAKVYIIPRKNATLRGSWKWKDTMEDFVNNTMSYLGQYYLRNNSESGFSADKRGFGWRVMQRRGDRIDTAITCKSVWHNLLNLYLA